MATTHQWCHECILNINLQEIIFDKIHDDRKSLSALVLTSKVVSESAERVLWRTLRDLLPLLRLLPGFQMHISANNGCGFSHPLNASDWVSFDKHAAWVKEITEWGTQALLQPQTWDILLSRRQPLLVNLKKLRCRLLAPSLAPFPLGTSRIPSNAENLGILPPFPPPAGLTHLCLAMNVSHTDLSRIPPEVDSTLEHLTVNNFVPWITRDLYRPLDHRFLPVLRSLTIHTIPPFQAPFPPFPGLKCLRLSSVSEITAVQLLGALESPDLQSVLIHNSSGKHICQIVAQRWSRTLTSFDFACTTLEDLRPLAECAALQTFRLKDCRAFHIDEFLDLASRWADIRTVSIPMASDISLSALTRLAHQFPLLLVGELDLTSLTPMPPIHETSVLEHNLKQLLLHSSPPQEEADVGLLARHLDRLFPRLDEIRYVGRIGAPDST
ncbi:hypothetical protein FB45DRAFT_923628 [Roridomyces roridus]|uniref:Uncharacterized protein n=1 Tax=Roridomyces roridus TaxID=1738132 RepID=A0AAD7BL91_9AGAR|nr:hypothetical protein FB45DRAFT_923628 [Roridomyces roridus]